MKPIGNIIKILRTEAGLTQAEFGKRIGVSKQAISNYESDIRRPTYETLEAICDVLNKPIGFFLSKEEQEEEYSKYREEYSLDLQRFSSQKSEGNSVPDEIRTLYDQLTPENRELAADFLRMLLGKQG